MRWIAKVSCLGCLLLFGCRTASADLLTFTDRALFNAELSSAPSLVDFDSASGSIPSGGGLDGLIFTYSWGAGVDFLAINSSLPTTSGNNSLGSTFGAAGNELTSGFNDIQITPPSSCAFGVTILSEELLDGDIFLSTGGVERVSIKASAFTQLTPTTCAYFLGLVETNSSQSLGSIGVAGAVQSFGVTYRLDDIAFATVSAVPEPSSLTASLLVARSATLHRRRRKPMLQAVV